ncbi:MAG: asparaginase [Candidatus Sericytochromatia bacterium]
MAPANPHGGAGRVLVVYNGGTIGMKRSTEGYTPEPGYLQAQMRAIPAFAHADIPEYVIHEQQPLIDSSNMHPDRWWSIAQDIARHYADFDGFVVLHGTDTLAYTASALPFMLQGLRKPVILTGSQIPLCELRNDAQENLITSLLLAARHPIPEVCLYFGGRLIRGCRATKLDAAGFQAFGSPNYPLLGEVGVEMDIFWERIRPLPEAGTPLEVFPLHHATVGALRLFPGISASVLENLLQPPLQGLVLETYGMGNGPAQDPAFLRVLRQASERGIVIVDCTQCVKGRVELSGYATGRALADVGVVSGLDLTTEAALAKLYFLLSAGHSPEEVRSRMGQNLCGELTL